MAINVQFAKGTTVPTTSTLVKGGIYFNTSNKNIYFNNNGTLVTYKGTDTTYNVANASSNGLMSSSHVKTLSALNVDVNYDKVHLCSILNPSETYIGLNEDDITFCSYHDMKYYVGTDGGVIYYSDLSTGEEVSLKVKDFIDMKNEIGAKALANTKADANHTHNSLTGCEALGTMDVYITSDISIYGGDATLNNSGLRFSNESEYNNDGWVINNAGSFNGTYGLTFQHSDTKLTPTTLEIHNNQSYLQLNPSAGLEFDSTGTIYGPQSISFKQGNTSGTYIDNTNITVPSSVIASKLQLKWSNSVVTQDLTAYDLYNFRYKTRCGSINIRPMIRWTSNGISDYGQATNLSQYGHIDYYEFAPNKFVVNMSFQITGTITSDASNYAWVDLMGLAKHLNVVWAKKPTEGTFPVSSNTAWETYRSGSWVAIAGAIHGNANSAGMGTDCTIQFDRYNNHVALCPGRKYSDIGRASGGWSLGYFDSGTVLQLNNIILQASDQFVNDKSIRLSDPGYGGYIILDFTKAIHDYLENRINFTWEDIIDAWNYDTSSIQVSYTNSELDIYSIEDIHTGYPVYAEDNFNDGSLCVRMMLDTSFGLVEGDIVIQDTYIPVQQSNYIRQDMNYMFYW